MSSEAGGVAALAVELLYEQKPELDARAIADTVRRILPKTVVMAEEPGVLLAHEDYPIAFEEGTKSILTMVVHPDGDRQGVGDLDLTQSWRFREAADALNEATTTLLVAEMLGAGGRPHDRAKAFLTTLRAVIEHTRPNALWTPAAQELLHPDQLDDHPLAGLVNVRLFQVEDDEDVMLMDTLGLHTLGLADFQMHFRDLDESRIGAFLFDLATYAFENPGALENGDTVGEARWRVQFEQAMVGPQRIVLDVNPGAPHAAGDR
jgi:hypothetical protein